MSPNGEKLAAITLDLEEDHAGMTADFQSEALAVLPDLVEQTRRAGIPVSAFVSGILLDRAPSVRDRLSDMDMHSHGYDHPTLEQARNQSIRAENLRKGLDKFESFFHRPALGYRAPYGIIDDRDLKLLSERGVKFDSSFFSGFHVSGVRSPRNIVPHIHKTTGLWEIPISCHPLWPSPYAMSCFSIYGDWWYDLSVNWKIAPQPLIFDFHLHDLVLTPAVEKLAPHWRWMYKRNKTPGLERLLKFCRRLKENGYRIVTMTDLFQRLKGSN